MNIRRKSFWKNGLIKIVNEKKSFFKIILVKPRNPVNIGAAARAMVNFGLSDLRIVAPYGPILKETIETADIIGGGETSLLNERDKTAVGAGDIIRNAKIFKTLKEAASDCVLALATSSLKKRKPDRNVILLKDALNYISKKEADEKNTALAVSMDTVRETASGIALVFGCEKTGLTVKDLSYCNAIINIPTKERQPSINLGQAVGIVCYEFAGRNGDLRLSCRKTEKPSLGEINSVVSLIRKKMEKDGISHCEWVETKIRKGFLDAKLTKAVLNTFKKILDGDK